MTIDVREAARIAGISLSEARRYHKGPYSSVLVEFPSKRKIFWNSTNYQKMEQIAGQHELELVGRWLRKAVTGGYIYAAYVGDSCIRINPLFKNAGKLLEEIKEVYGMHAQ